MAGGHRRTFTAALGAIGLALALIGGHATTGPLVGLVNTVIGVGGSSDPVSERLPAKLNQTVVPPDYSYIGSAYPATLNMDHSVRIGMPVLHEHFSTTSGKVLVAGYSLGALLVEQLKRDVAASADPPSPLDLSFLQIGTPFIPNGGVFARFPGFFIPNVVSPMGPAQPTQYDTTYIVNEYDPYGDFPAYFNPVALLNTVLAHHYAHLDSSYDPIDPQDEANHVKVVQNSAGGLDTYILVPNPRLPLLGPVRDIAHRLGLTPVTERLLGAIEPLLRVIIDMAYTDREFLNPEVRTPFSMITPPHKIREALLAVPGAVREGLENLVGIDRTPVTPPVPVTAAQPAAAPEPEPKPELDPDAELEDETAARDELESPPPVGRKTGGPVVTLKDTPRSAFGGNRMSPRTAQSPARASESGQDRRDRGAEAA